MTDGQTDRQTESIVEKSRSTDIQTYRSENIISFGGGKNKKKSLLHDLEKWPLEILRDQVLNLLHSDKNKKISFIHSVHTQVNW